MACALIAQAGGPTAVMNATLIAAIRQAREARHTFSRFLGSVSGLKGILEDRFIDLFSQDDTLLDRFADTPGAALGSVGTARWERHSTSKVKLTQSDMNCRLSVFRRL
jgi:6-phosphofructokinase